MGSSLFAGISGLASAGKQLDVIGNNIANVNTVGFRSGKIHFGDILSQSVTGGAAAGMQVGRGVDVAAITTQFSSGSFETTSNATDLAIDGDGFFIVKDADGGEYYTRAGAFHLDNEGYLVDVNSLKVQGYNLAGSDPDTITDISLSGVQSEPSSTTEISVGANLDAATVAGETFNASQTAYDSLGTIHSLKLTFQKTEGTGYWGFKSYLDNTAATAQSYSGLKFDTDGVLEKVYSATGTESVTANASDGTVSVAINDGATGLEAGNQFTITRGADANTWVIAGVGGNYGDVAITSTGVADTDDELVIDYDDTDGVATNITLTLGSTWYTGDIITVTTTDATTVTSAITHATMNGAVTDTINNEGQLFQDGTLELTRGASASWSFADTADKGGYENITVLASSDTEITLDFDGAGVADVTLALTGTWAEGNTIQYVIDQTEADPIDVNLTMPSITGATIGTSGVVAWDLAGTTAEVITGYASTSVIRTLVHDGYSSGSLKSISVVSDGVISGFFTNGQTSDISQIVLADFPNTTGLKRMGKNLFSTTVESGSAVPNRPGSAGMGEISPNSLEMSNTDIATEFINMITAQRAYQASAKIVTVTDQMMAELMNIKR
ncbi:MAG: flagellar hook-basal body complex protein [Deltaproteobacteria bacterium]|nr:flagellar hook-basal body complex protein [Deltaproteobacteria bacterium]